MARVSFNNNPNPFFKALKEKVDGYFDQNQLHTSGGRKLYLKSIFQVLTAITIYIVLVFFNPGTFLSIILCSLLGMNFAVIGFNIMHEGGHQSLSKYAWLNTAGAYFLNILGGNSYFWKIKHNINHHTYTNIEGMDSDIDIKPFMRIHKEQPRHWFHRFQHFYWVFLYGISYLVWIFWDDFEKYFTGKVAQDAIKKLVFREHFIFWFTKLSYIGLFIVLPIFMVGLANALIGFIIISFICGLSIAIVFQLAHVVEGTQFPKPNEGSSKIEHEWAIHQLNTTANFAMDNKLISWLLGGLNFQIEHHLFPKVSHVHYPKISQLVKETCEQFNVKYIEYPTMAKAVSAHLSHIKALGKR